MPTRLLQEVTRLASFWSKTPSSSLKRRWHSTEASLTSSSGRTIWKNSLFFSKATLFILKHSNSSVCPSYSDKNGHIHHLVFYPIYTENEVDNADILLLAEALKTNTSLTCLDLSGFVAVSLSHIKQPFFILLPQNRQHLYLYWSSTIM